jgi:hypothetical protein
MPAKTRPASFVDLLLGRSTRCLLAAAAIALTLSPANAQQFPATNSEKGCMMITLASIFRIEQMSDVDAQSCQQLKTTFDGDISKCVIATGMAYNRSHGRGDFDKPPTEIRDSVLKGCSMLVTDRSEQVVEYVLKQQGILK